MRFPTPTPAQMTAYVAATITRRGLPAARPILLGAAQDWETAGEPDLGAAIRAAIPAEPLTQA